MLKTKIFCRNLCIFDEFTLPLLGREKGSKSTETPFSTVKISEAKTREDILGNVRLLGRRTTLRERAVPEIVGPLSPAD